MICRTTIRRMAAVALLATLPMLTACRVGAHSGVRAPGAEPASGAARGTPRDDVNADVRRHGYALLYSTVKDESRVDGATLFKNPDPKVTNLLKAIAHASGQAKTQLETFAKADPTINLKDEGLPSMEVKTRDSIASATTKKVLLHGGKEFEFTILLTQTEALNYIAHMATVLADQDPNPNRKTYLNQLAQNATSLYDRVLTMLKAPYLASAS